MGVKGRTEKRLPTERTRPYTQCLPSGPFFSIFYSSSDPLQLQVSQPIVLHYQPLVERLLQTFLACLQLESTSRPLPVSLSIFITGGIIQSSLSFLGMGVGVQNLPSHSFLRSTANERFQSSQSLYAVSRRNLIIQFCVIVPEVSLLIYVIRHFISQLSSLLLELLQCQLVIAQACQNRTRSYLL